MARSELKPYGKFPPRWVEAMLRAVEGEDKWTFVDMAEATGEGRAGHTMLVKLRALRQSMMSPRVIGGKMLALPSHPVLTPLADAGRIRFRLRQVGNFGIVEVRVSPPVVGIADLKKQFDRLG